MCQTNVLLEKEDGSEEVLLENVTSIEVLAEGLRVTSLFEGSKQLEKLAIRRIDFSGGKVYLSRLM